MMMTIRIMMMMIMLAFFSIDSKQYVAMLKSTYDIRQTTLDKIAQNIIECQFALWICDIKQMCFETPLETAKGLDTLDG